MLFERLELLNFASYYGDNVIDLDTTSEKPVIVVLGGTGNGKTSIFDAINWSLYGGEYEQDLLNRRKRKIEDYANQKALREGFEKGESIEMGCTLYFEHENLHYYITQSICVKPTKNAKGDLIPIVTDRMTALYRINQSGDHVRLEYNTIFLDDILPSNVKDYFLFDGDRIYQLSNPGSSQEVRNAIYRVVDLELIKNGITHLSDVAKEYRSSAKRQSKGELSPVTTEHIVEREKLDRLKKALKEYKDEELAIKAQIQVIEDKLSGLPDTSKLQTRREQLVQQLISTEEQLDGKRIEIRKLASASTLGLASQPVLLLVNELDSRRNKGLIPRNISKTLLNDLLKMKKCLCGTEFDEGDQIYQNLKKRLEQESNRSSGQEFLELLFQLRSTSDSVSESITALKTAYGEYNRLSDFERELNIAIKEIDVELDKLPKEDVAALILQLRERQDALSTAQKNATLTSVRIETCEKRIKELKDLIEKLGKQQKEFLRLQRREFLAQKASDELDHIYETFAEDSRKSIEELTRKEFQQFVQSAAAYNVALNENYELEVIDPNGNRALQRLSMGQSQCLSLSFITAISRVSEKNPPLVIDMPFGRLDHDVHDAVSKRLPELASQLILFLIPQVEWNSVTEKNLRSKSNHVYSLKFDEKNQITEINSI